METYDGAETGQKQSWYRTVMRKASSRRRQLTQDSAILHKSRSLRNSSSKLRTSSDKPEVDMKKANDIRGKALRKKLASLTTGGENKQRKRCILKVEAECGPVKRSERQRLRREKLANDDTKLTSESRSKKKESLCLTSRAKSQTCGTVETSEDKTEVQADFEGSTEEAALLSMSEEGREEKSDSLNEEHNPDTSKPRVLGCPYCKFKYTDTHELIPHIKDFHSTHYDTEKASFKCLYCDTTCLKAKTIRSHMNKLHNSEHKNLKEPERLKCTAESCTEEFLSRKQLSYHLAYVHKVAQPKVRKERLTGVRVEVLRERAKLKEEGKLAEWGKKKTTSKNEKLSTRVASRTKTEKHKSARLADCHETCWRIAEKKEKFPCAYCLKVFQHHSIMVLHESAHEVKLRELNLVKVCQCPTCGDEFPSYYQLDKHKQEIHGDEFEPHACPVCGKRFTTSHYVKMHIETVHEKKTKFLCDFCAKAYRHKSGLQRHKEAHHTAEKDKKPKPKYTCEQCGAVTMTRAGYVQHVKRHMGLKNFACHYCSRKFGTAGHLKTHERIHTGLKEFKCPLCDKLFTSQGTLYNHLYRYAVHGRVKKVQHYARKSDTAALRDLLLDPDVADTDKGKPKTKGVRKKAPETADGDKPEMVHTAAPVSTSEENPQKVDSKQNVQTLMNEENKALSINTTTRLVSDDEDIIQQIAIGAECQIPEEQWTLLQDKEAGLSSVPGSEQFQVVQLGTGGEIVDSGKIVVQEDQPLEFVIMQNFNDELLEGTDIHIEYQNESGEVIHQVLQIKPGES